MTQRTFRATSTTNKHGVGPSAFELPAVAGDRGRIASGEIVDRCTTPFVSTGGYVFKYATTDEELEQVHRLNFETFVREIPQHADPGTSRLVDKFHTKNTYIIAKSGSEVVGMISAHDQPPFSIADRLADASVLDSLGQPLEVRLLSILPRFRKGLIFAGLVGAIHEHARANGHTHLLISGVVDRVPIYRKLGFRLLGPAVVFGRSSFVPMIGDLNVLNDSSRRLLDRCKGVRNQKRVRATAEPISLLPGPVKVSLRVSQALGMPPISHRREEFTAKFERVRDLLTRLVGGESRVALFCGSGTLANDIVASTLAANRTAGAGLILANGEFGERLTHQASQFSLKFRVLRQHWGKPWDLQSVTEVLAADKSIGWVWGVHLETSTGMVNDLEGLKHVCHQAGARVCIDAVSSLGAIPVDFNGVHLASSASGKALGSFAGLGIVFASPTIGRTPGSRRVLSYLDLPNALQTRGAVFTIPSPLLAALEQALNFYDTPQKIEARFHQYAKLGEYVRGRLKTLGIQPIAESNHAPVVTSFVPPGDSSDRFAAYCQSLGYEISHASDYLQRQGWVQIATMGDIGDNDLHSLFDALQDWYPHHLSEVPTESSVSGVHPKKG